MIKTKSTRIEPDYEAQFAAWQTTPNPQTTGQLLDAVSPILHTAVRTYGGPKASPTLQTRAKVLAADAFKTYDPARGAMKTHLMSHLQRLRRYSAGEQQIVRMPELAGLQRQQLATAEQQMTEQLGRGPSTTELADNMGVSRKRIASLRSAISPTAEGMTSKTTAEGEFRQATGQLAAPQLPAWIDLAYDDLSERDQYILERSLGLYGHEPQSATQIAAQLHISSAALSKRVAQLQSKLDQWEDLYARRK